MRKFQAFEFETFTENFLDCILLSKEANKNLSLIIST